MIDDSSRTPTDRSADPSQAHRLPPASERGLLVLQRAAPRAIEWTADRLVEGGVVSFPTDTVYALAASLAHPEALRRVYSIKGRPEEKPLPVLLAAPDDLDRVALDLDPRLLSLLARYWPGPLTAVVPARHGMPPEVTGTGPSGQPTVATRVPNHFLALEVIERAGGAIAATSANRSGRPPARAAAEVAAALGDAVDILLDGGVAPGGVPSTVVGFDAGRVVVYREGAIPGEQIAAAWSEILAGGGTA